ncbi:isochorismatase family cysteine hydrolase [Pectinatus sottacetonis]|uniref:isochorismatase family cysteine hydrolase n=1 Tax=Pectinatus sottacetonis TaxID=1002795 RepID=UPI0018C4A860|nr:isochorismatase family cysteine hydrolase [Pectinatus sottacetonis]
MLTTLAVSNKKIPLQMSQEALSGGSMSHVSILVIIFFCKLITFLGVKMSNILVVVDIQKEYITKGRAFYINNIGKSLTNAKKILEKARKEKWNVIHIKHLQDGKIFNPNSGYSDFVDGFIPLDNEIVLEKHNFSCFSNTKFALEMKNINQDDNVFVIGYSSTLCCLATIIDGYCRGIKFNYISDASNAKKSEKFNEAELHSVMTDVLSRYANIINSEELLF